MGLDGLNTDYSALRFSRHTDRGFQLVEKVTAGDFGNIARDKGLLLVGAAENTIRLLPPLNTSKEEVNQAFEILQNVILEMKKN